MNDKGNNKKFMDEFEGKYPDLKHDGDFNFILERDEYRWRGYLEACKKRSEEIEILKFERVPVELYAELCNEKDKYKKQANCPYQHNFVINRNFLCTKCGWTQPNEDQQG